MTGRCGTRCSTRLRSTMNEQSLQTLLAVIEIAAICAFAVSGLIEAARKRMDIVGVFAVAFVTP